MQTVSFIKELADLDLKEGVIGSDAGLTKSAIVDVERYDWQICSSSFHPHAGRFCRCQRIISLHLQA